MEVVYCIIYYQHAATIAYLQLHKQHENNQLRGVHYYLLHTYMFEISCTLFRLVERLLHSHVIIQQTWKPEHQQDTQMAARIHTALPLLAILSQSNNRQENGGDSQLRTYQNCQWQQWSQVGRGSQQVSGKLNQSANDCRLYICMNKGWADQTILQKNLALIIFTKCEYRIGTTPISSLVDLAQLLLPIN